MERRGCRVCGEEKSLDDFYYRKDSGTYRGDCKKCNISGRKEYKKKYREENRQKIKEIYRIYEETNKEEISERKKSIIKIIKI